MTNPSSELQKSNINRNAPLVNIAVGINGKSLTLTCHRDDETHIRHLAEYVNLRIRESASATRAMSESSVLSMTLLAMADDLLKLQSSTEDKPVDPPPAEENIPSAAEITPETIENAAITDNDEIDEERERLRQENQTLEAEKNALQADNVKLTETICDITVKVKQLGARLEKLSA